MWRHRWQPTRLPRPWDSPGKNTGVVYHFLLQCMKVKSESEVAQSCLTPSDPMDCSLPGSSIHGIFQARVLEWVAIAFSASSMTMPQIVINLTSSGHRVCILQVCFILHRKKCIMVYRLNNCDSTNFKWPWKSLLWGGLYFIIIIDNSALEERLNIACSLMFL